jgi:hypothetical protein
MVNEDTLARWTAPSSETEQEKQERTERMVREAIEAHPAFAACRLDVYAKGSYANNTNVRADSDVDIAVECTDVLYWEEARPGIHDPGPSYTGGWTPPKLRAELESALSAYFKGQVDASGSTAIAVHSGSARVDADVVPCFSYVYYPDVALERRGTKIFTKSGRQIVNYPLQQLENGRAKNRRTGYAFKKAVRILKRIENALAASTGHAELPSYFVECLVYNCPDHVVQLPTWTATLRAILVHLWEGLEGPEPTVEEQRWLEVNEYFFLFHPAQPWSREMGRRFANDAWNFMGLG